MRLRIIDILRAGPQNVSDLAAALGVEMVILSHHLGILFHAGLVERSKQGRFVIYQLPEGLLAKGGSRSGRDVLDLGCCSLEVPKR